MMDVDSLPKRSKTRFDRSPSNKSRSSIIPSSSSSTNISNSNASSSSSITAGNSVINNQFRSKKTFAPVATASAIKQNQEELNKIEKEARKTAKEIAANELAMILTQPEQLVQVEQLRLEKNDAKRLVSGTLKNLIKTKLDDVQSGLMHMDICIRSLDTISEDYNLIVAACKNVDRLIKKEHYELIQEVNIARNNLLSTKYHVESILAIPPSLTETRKLMNDDINILDVHRRVRNLQRSRTKLLSAAKQYPAQAKQLESELSGVVELANAFDAKIRELMNNHFNLALQRPAVLIKVLQVVNREMKVKEFKANKKKSKDFSNLEASESSIRTEETSEYEQVEESRPTITLSTATTSSPDDKNNLDDAEWVFDSKKVTEWVREACLNRFDSMFENCKDKDKGQYVLSKCLETASDKMFDDLTKVFDDLRPCFPPWLDILKLYFQVYHSSLSKIIKEWSASGVLSPDDVLDLAKWLSSTYQIQMLRLGATKADLTPNLHDDLLPMIDTYSQNIEKIMTEWALRLMVQDRSLDTARVSNDLYYTTGPTNLFLMVNSRLDLALSTAFDKIILATSEGCLAVLKTYQKEMTTALKREGKQWDFNYLLALINNFTKCYEFMEDFQQKIVEKLKEQAEKLPFNETKKGFSDLGITSREVLLSKLFGELTEETNQICTRPWVLDEVKPASVITDTLVDYFNGDIVPHLLPYHSKKLAVEAIEKLVSIYISSLFMKRLNFDEPLARKLDEDIALYINFAVSQQNKEKGILPIFSPLKLLKELMIVDVSDVKTTVETILKQHPDFREDMAIFMIDYRDNMDRSDKRTAMNEIRAIFSKYQRPNNATGPFSHLELPGSLIDSLLMLNQSTVTSDKTRQIK